MVHNPLIWGGGVFSDKDLHLVFVGFLKMMKVGIFSFKENNNNNINGYDCPYNGPQTV